MNSKVVPGVGLEPTRLKSQGILSPSCLPIPPPGQVWRRGPELNRCTRFCRPLRNHSATAPYSKMKEHP